jgi:hypothetical protein
MFLTRWHASTRRHRQRVTGTKTTDPSLGLDDPGWPPGGSAAEGRRGLIDELRSTSFGDRASRLPAIAAAATAATATTTAATTAVAVVATTATAAVVTATATATVATTAAAAAITAAAIAAATAGVATTATAAEATAAAAATAATATAALLALLGLIHAKRTAVECAAVHALDRLGGFFGSSHGDEREAAGATGLAIRDQVDVTYRSEFLERSADAISIGIERKVSNIQTSVHRLLDLAQVTTVPPRRGPWCSKAGVSKRRTRLQTPTEHRTKTCELWQVRSYSWPFTIATRKVA